MAISLEDAKEYRDRLHNLDLNNPKDKEFYESLRYNFIKINEGCNSQAYDDKTSKPIIPGIKPIGDRTIGIGFNMDAGDTKKIWEEVFNKKNNSYISFEAAKNGKIKLTQKQIDKLFDRTQTIIEEKLQTIYRNHLNKFRANERLIIEDAYFNHPTLANRSSKFYKYMISYVETSETSFLLQAIYEIEHRSNPDKNSGLQNRRNVQAAILSSHLSPLYSKPNEDLLPYKEISAKIADTIIPKNIDHWPKSDDNNYYIWRTCGDNKVRPHHAKLEGKIFKEKEDDICTAISQEYIVISVEFCTRHEERSLLNAR